MKYALFEFGKKTIFSQFFKNLLNAIDMSLLWVYGVDENVI